jgi:hypothetical protein
VIERFLIIKHKKQPLTIKTRVFDITPLGNIIVTTGFSKFYDSEFDIIKKV